MEEFKKGEIVLYKDYIEESDWNIGIYLEYDKKDKSGRPHIVSPYFTEFNDGTFSIDKYVLHRRHVKKLPHINFGNDVIWREEEEHAD